ncbi:MAG: ATP-binding cassette domain-containing protein, partial [Firmicutes bacterium]|nr:ATP-binding cassette domain-containing protein [Bacillota bacterium]
MERFRIEQLTFQYPGREEPALRDVDLTVEPGEFLVIFGPSGCGKTTLLRHLKPELMPHGLRTGRIRFGEDLLEDADTAGRIGFVLQDPEDGIVCDKVWHELVFGLENLGMDQAQMRTRAAETAAFFGMEDWFYRDVTTLSGGQKQILCLASAMILQPEVLVLDEPTSRLDPVAAEEFLGALQKVHQELGTTVILSEHRLEGVLPLADRVLGMDRGRIVVRGEPRAVEEALRESGSPLLRMLPVPMRLYGAVLRSPLAGLAEGPCPVTIREGRKWLSGLTERMKEAGRPVHPAGEPSDDKAEEAASVEIKEIWYRYERQGKDVLKGLSLTAGQGGICTVLGGNGSGKSTVMMNVAGILKPQRGKIRTAGRTALVPQEPATLFTRQTAGQELEEMLPEGANAREREALLLETARKWGLEEVLAAHPYDLSGGEQQRLALAKVMMKEPEILLLDEPTKGMDPMAKEDFARELERLKQEGITILIVSHDVDFCAEVSDRCGMLFDGVILSEGTPAEFFREKRFYTTSAGRMSRGILPDVVTYNDILERLGIDPEAPSPSPSVTPPPEGGGKDSADPSEPEE